MSEQLRVQIAEWMGYKRGVHPGACHENVEGWYSPSGRFIGHDGHLPDFTGDLNAIASAEAKLSEREYSDYFAMLSFVVQRDGSYRIACATALQRATALARVINQERE